MAQRKNLGNVLENIAVEHEDDHLKSQLRDPDLHDMDVLVKNPNYFAEVAGQWFDEETAAEIVDRRNKVHDALPAKDHTGVAATMPKGPSYTAPELVDWALFKTATNYGSSSEGVSAVSYVADLFDRSVASKGATGIVALTIASMISTPHLLNETLNLLSRAESVDEMEQGARTLGDTVRLVKEEKDEDAVKYTAQTLQKYRENLSVPIAKAISLAATGARDATEVRKIAEGLGRVSMRKLLKDSPELIEGDSQQRLAALGAIAYVPKGGELLEGIAQTLMGENQKRGELLAAGIEYLALRTRKSAEVTAAMNMLTGFLDNETVQQTLGVYKELGEEYERKATLILVNAVLKNNNTDMALRMAKGLEIIAPILTAEGNERLRVYSKFNPGTNDHETVGPLLDIAVYTESPEATKAAGATLSKYLQLKGDYPDRMNAMVDVRHALIYAACKRDTPAERTEDVMRVSEELQKLYDLAVSPDHEDLSKTLRNPFAVRTVTSRVVRNTPLDNAAAQTYTDHLAWQRRRHDDSAFQRTLGA